MSRINEKPSYLLPLDIDCTLSPQAVRVNAYDFSRKTVGIDVLQEPERRGLSYSS
jgi:hypothetical protein